MCVAFLTRSRVRGVTFLNMDAKFVEFVAPFEIRQISEGAAKGATNCEFCSRGGNGMIVSQQLSTLDGRCGRSPVGGLVLRSCSCFLPVPVVCGSS